VIHAIEIPLLWSALVADLLDMHADQERDRMKQTIELVILLDRRIFLLFDDNAGESFMIWLETLDMLLGRDGFAPFSQAERAHVAELVEKLRMVIA
jgi:hypothetical protein